MQNKKKRQRLIVFFQAPLPSPPLLASVTHGFEHVFGNGEVGGGGAGGELLQSDTVSYPLT